MAFRSSEDDTVEAQRVRETRGRPRENCKLPVFTWEVLTRLYLYAFAVETCETYLQSPASGPLRGTDRGVIRTRRSFLGTGQSAAFPLNRDTGDSVSCIYMTVGQVRIGLILCCIMTADTRGEDVQLSVIKT